eukprot:12555597-Alexandrium_andersonii.AAC.1
MCIRDSSSTTASRVQCGAGWIPAMDRLSVAGTQRKAWRAPPAPTPSSRKLSTAWGQSDNSTRKSHQSAS